MRVVRFSVAKIFDFIHGGRTDNGEFMTARQIKLESLCCALFHEQAQVAAGRLQLLGLERIGRRMGGRKWAAMQKTVHAVCDAALNKYMAGDDVAIRHKENNYLLLFAEPDAHEVEVKTMMIAEDIKCCLMAYPGFAELEILNQISLVRADKMLQSVLPFPENLNHAFERSLGGKPQELEFVSGIPDFSHTMERDSAYYTHVRYLPVWDQFKKRLISYMCLAINLKAPELDPLRGHMALFEGIAPALRGELDAAILARVIDWLGNNPDSLGSFGIICPVHYATLRDDVGRERYNKLCQQIDPAIKQYILFMVMGVPQVSWESLNEVAMPLKTYGRVLCGEVSLRGQVDFESLRMSGFDHVGGILEAPGAEDGQKGALMDIRSFVVRAKKHLINKTFVLGVDDPDAAATVAQMGVRYMAGTAVHECLREPKPELRFQESAVFRSWQKSGMGRMREKTEERI